MLIFDYTKEEFNKALKILEVSEDEFNRLINRYPEEDRFCTDNRSGTYCTLLNLEKSQIAIVAECDEWQNEEGFKSMMRCWHANLVYALLEVKGLSEENSPFQVLG